MQDDILKDLEELRDRTDFIIKNKDLTEVKNIAAQCLFEKLGFSKEGIIRQDILSHGSFVDRIAYGFLREDWG